MRSADRPGNLVVIGKAVRRRMADVDRDDGRMVVEPSADGEWMESKDVEQQRDEYEKPELPHRRHYR